jgi:formate hydrogenlyase subunit 3/multisubunit Na+/H+ antiporter MnhD subunit
VSTAFAVTLALLGAATGAPGASRRLAGLLTLAGSLLYLAIGFAAAGGWAHVSLDLGSWLGFGESQLRIDRLAGIFLALTGASGAAVSLAYVEHRPRRLVAGLHALLLLDMGLVIAADQAFVFLLAWEALTLTLYLLAGADRERPGTLVAGYFTGAMNKLGGGALLAAFALLYAQTGSFRFSDWAAASPSLSPGVRSAAFVLLLAGFGTKVGMVPFQGWLPVGHAAAPGAASATLSGMAVNAGFYGLWRIVFATLSPPALWWGELALLLGGISALVGILYAIAQDDIKRFLGFSTIEHSGIILIGFGTALVGRAAGEPKLAAAGLLAATLHVIAHALAKTLAFLGADRVARAAGTRELGPLGGLARRLSRTAGMFAVATLTLAAIPPLGGFVSEWLTFEALLQGFRLDSTVARLVMALGAALLALTAGLALLAFAKVFGTVFLGGTRGALGRVVEPSDLGSGAILLAVAALALGPAAPWEIRWLGRGLAQILGFDLAPQAISHPLVLGPVYERFSVLAPTWLAVVLPAYVLLTGALVWALLRPPARRAPVWLSGSAVSPSAVQYTPAAYSNPVRVVLRSLYGLSRRLQPRPAPRAGAMPALVLETRIVPAFEHYLYGPMTTGALWLSGQARRLQSGKLGAYLVYMLAVLLIVLALIPALRS